MLQSLMHRLSGDWELPWREAIEILLIGVVIYAALRFLEGTRGARLLRAVLVILTGFLVVAFIAQLLVLDRLLFLYPYFVSGVFLIALVVFQPELRRGLMRIGERVGRRSLTVESERVIEPVVQACASLSRRKIGALIALERRVPLGALVETGVRLDAGITRELLETIFWPGSALHDLGVVISHGRIAAAGCEFPLAEPGAVERVLGSRHRAALGMSVEADVLVAVVSEETGTISVAERGTLHTGLTMDSLRDILTAGLLHQSFLPITPPGELDVESTEAQAATQKPVAPATDAPDADQPAPAITEPESFAASKAGVE